MTGKDRRKGYYAREVEAEAAHQGMTPEEYGGYKGPNYIGPKPYTSARGILAIISLVTAWVLALIIYAWVNIAAGVDVQLEGGAWFGGIVLVFVVLPMGWMQYFRERKAERLRRERGLTLQPPTRRHPHGYYSEKSRG